MVRYRLHVVGMLHICGIVSYNKETSICVSSVITNYNINLLNTTIWTLHGDCLKSISPSAKYSLAKRLGRNNHTFDIVVVNSSMLVPVIPSLQTLHKMLSFKEDMIFKVLFLFFDQNET